MLKIAARICAISLLLIISVLMLPAVPVSADGVEPRCWAVFVGLSEYEHIEPAEGCAEGASIFYEKISAIWGIEQCKLLTDKDATKYNVKEAIKWIANNAQKDDTVLIYYSAHGDPRGYISTYHSLYMDSWISTAELKRWLNSIDSDRITVIVDSCHSGRFSTALAGEGWVILTSSRYDEVSWVYAGIGGIFTSFILAGIEDTYDSNADYSIAAEELFEYSENRTIAETEKGTESVQHPVMSDGYDGEISLVTLFVFSTDPKENMEIVLTIDNETYDYTSDGTQYNIEIALSPGSAHVVDITPFYETASGSRYTFVSWKHGDTSPITTISEGGSYTAIYDPEYRLVIESPYGNPEGQGWYKQGVTAIASIEEFVDRPSIRRYFTGWRGSYESDKVKIEIEMDAPKNLVAEWLSEYLLTIHSTHGYPTGGGWYEEDAEATVAVQSIDEPTARHYFTGWSGDYTGQEDSFQITIDSPKTITANWESEYLLTIESEYGEPEGEGWYDEGDIAEVTIESIERPDTKHYFTGWSGDYAGNENSLEISMDSAKTLIANWHSEYLLSIESEHGEPTGEGWYDEGTTVTISVPRSNGLIVRQVFDGWGDDFNGKSSKAEVEIDKALSITAKWRTDYLQLYLLLGGLLIVAAVVVLIYRLRRPKSARYI